MHTSLVSLSISPIKNPINMSSAVPNVVDFKMISADLLGLERFLMYMAHRSCEILMFVHLQKDAIQ